MRSLSVVALLLVSACGGGGDAGPDAILTSYNCATETRADTFSAGMDKPGTEGVLDFKLMSADPAPPARGDNTWMLEVDQGGAPLSGLASQIKVTPYMPDHQHGTPIHVVVTAGSADGQYELTPVNLWMPGLWQTTIQVTGGGSGGPADNAVFAFCLSS